MAATEYKYDIYVHFDGGSGEKSAVAGTGTGSTGTDAPSDEGGSAGEKQVVNKLKSLVSFAAIKSTADKIVNTRISQVSLRTGAAQYEERLSYVYNTSSQIVGAGASLVAGGLVGGPAGVAVATIGLIVSGVNKAMDIAQKSQVLQMQESLENVSIGMARVRAGVSGRRDKNQ